MAYFEDIEWTKRRERDAPIEMVVEIDHSENNAIDNLPDNLRRVHDGKRGYIWDSVRAKVIGWTVRYNEKWVDARFKWFRGGGEVYYDLFRKED